MSVIARITTLKQRPILMGLFGAVFAVSSVIGPLIGGAFSDHVSWRWCFYINLPVGGAAIVAVAIFLPYLPPVEKGKSMRQSWLRLDWIGTTLCLGMVTTLLIALQWGGNEKPWNSTTIIVLLVFFALFLLSFVVWEWRLTEDAILPFEILLRRNVFGTSFACFFAYMGFVIFNYYLPLLYQVRGHSATRSGIDILVFMISGVVASLFAGGVASATSCAWPILILAPYIASAGFGLFFTVTQFTPASRLLGLQVLVGVGLGCVLQLPVVVAQADFTDKQHLIPQATSLVTFLQLLESFADILLNSNAAGAVFSGQLHAQLRLFSSSISQNLQDELLASVEAISKFQKKKYHDAAGSAADTGTAGHIRRSNLKTFSVANVIAILLILYAIRYFVSRCSPEHPNSPPIARTYIPWLGCAVSFVFRRSDLLNECRIRYGPVYKLMVAGRYFVVVSTPRTIANATKTPPEIFQPLDEKVVMVVTGLSERLHYVGELLHRTAYIFIVNGLTKHRMSPITVPTNKRLFSNLRGVIDKSDSSEISISIPDFVNPNIYRAVIATFFGTQYIPDTYDNFYCMDQGMFYLLSNMSLFCGKSLKAAARMSAEIEPYVRRALGGDIEAPVEDSSHIISDSLWEFRKGGLTVYEIARLLVVVIWGINSNVMKVTNDALAYLLSDPDTYHHICTSIRTAISEKYKDFESFLVADPNAIDIEEFAILDSVILETLRITALAASFREVLSDTYLSGENGKVYFVQKGEYVLADVRGMHFDATLFPQPEKFITDRFMIGQASVKFKNLRPFGGGSSICKGRDFAQYIIKMFLLQTIYLFDIVPGEYKPSIDANRSVAIGCLRGYPVIRMRKRFEK
ncbi:hypothetical protein EW145_g2713 [Phellinidium pouzarii]|uniref:Major facilitator superfamily (MFS) profile domain-containing protein n=1 Tax=Phellinidium pouzarii TaxID=167371 RepID=A0A4S4L9R6_9AGAM|nr:hypothetical protein EW145_g2713 [Phellinidium pouzarii]